MTASMKLLTVFDQTSCLLHGCRFHPPEGFAPFLLQPGLCYVNALENAASALEIAAVAGKNCALLLHQQFTAAGGGVSGHVSRDADGDVATADDGVLSVV